MRHSTAGMQQPPWDELSRSVYQSGRVHEHSGHLSYDAADAEIQSALEHREEARVRVLNALERAGATPLTIRQVTPHPAVKALNACTPGRLGGGQGCVRANASDGARGLVQVEEAMDRRAVKVEPSDYELYRRSLQRDEHVRHPGLASARDEGKAGLGCTLELLADGRHVVAGVQAGGACSENGIQMGATILSVDGVPLRSMSMEHVRQLTMGLVGTHVCVRYRPAGVHAEYPPLERVLTRMPASFARPSASGAYVPDRAVGSVASARESGSASGMDTWRSSSTLISMSKWLQDMGLFKSTPREARDDVGLGTDGDTIRQAPIRHRPHSARASQRAEFLSGAGECPAPFNPPSGSIRQIADQYMAETHRSHSKRASNEPASAHARPVTIPPAYDIVKRPQSVSSVELQHVVEDILDRRSRRFAHLLHGDVRPSRLATIADDYVQRPVNDDIDLYAQDARLIAASSVLSSEGLESGRNYLYPQEVEAGALDVCVCVCVCVQEAN